MVHRALATASAAVLLALAPMAARAQGLPGYVIQPGDKITLEVFSAAGQKVDVVAGERIVDRNGEIHLPFIGTVKALGLDQNTLRGALQAGYGAFYPDAVINVKVELRVNVTGAVPRPGQFFLDPTSTLFDALAQAGGSNVEYAVIGSQIPGDPREVRLVRGGIRTTLNFHPTEISDEVLNMRIQSGDWLHVPPEDRTAIRDQVLFWGSMISFTTSIIGLVVLLGK